MILFRNSHLDLIRSTEVNGPNFNNLVLKNVEDVPDIIEFIYKGNTSTWNLDPTLEKIEPKILKLFLASIGETRFSHDISPSSRIMLFQLA